MCEKTFAFESQVVKNQEIIEDIYELEIDYPQDLLAGIRPGQYVNLYLPRQDLLLARPISICKVGEDSLKLVYKALGAGTKELALLEPGDWIKLSIPLGNGYDLSKEFKEAWLVGGGLGIPPLLELAHSLKKTGCVLNVVLGYRDKPFLAEKFAQLADKLYIVSEEEGHGIKGNVLDVVTKEFQEDQAGIALAENDLASLSFFSSGPLPMLEAVSKFCQERDLNIQVSLEERMACGFGACVGCVRKIREGDQLVSRRVCKEGPVFDGRKVVWHD